MANSLQDKVNELAAEFAKGVIRALRTASVAEIADFSAASNGRPRTTATSRKIAVPEPVAGKSPPQTRARRSKGASESLHRAKRIVAVDASDAVTPEPQRAQSQRPGLRRTLPPPHIEDGPAVEPVVENVPVTSGPIRSPDPERPQSEPARPLPEPCSSSTCRPTQGRAVRRSATHWVSRRTCGGSFAKRRSNEATFMDVILNA